MEVNQTVLEKSDTDNAKQKRASIKLYDFKRPDKFSLDQLRTLQMMHENFARVCTTTISAQLRTIAALHVASVDQLTYSEFMLSVPNPGLLAIVNMNPLRGSAILEITPNIVNAMLDRLCGGRIDAPENNSAIERKALSISEINLIRDDIKKTRAGRELSDIELSITERMIVRLLENLRESWSMVLDLNPKLGSIETNPQFAQMVHPNDMVVLITLDMQVNGIKGLMNFCIPYITIESLIHKLSATYWYASIRSGRKGETPASVLNTLKVESHLSIDTDPTPLSLLGNLSKGTLIKLSNFNDGKAQLTAGNKDVLQLKRDDSDRSGLSFNTTETITNVPALFAEKPDPAAEIRATIEPLLRPLSDEIKRTADDTRKRFDEFAERQRELTARLSQKVEVNGDASTTSSTPFGFIRDAEHAANLLKSERPQTIAMILTYLEKDIAAEILGKFDQQLQIDVASRIATLDRINPDVIKEAEHVLERKFATLAAEETAPRGGLNCVVDILNIANRNVERTVIEGLEKADPSLAEDLKKRMFVFEDVVILDDRTIKALIARIDRKDLALALKAVSKNVQAHFEKCMPPQEWAAILKTQEDIGHVRLSTVEESQQRIVNVIRSMHESGEIIVPRADEKVV